MTQALTYFFLGAVNFLAVGFLIRCGMLWKASEALVVPEERAERTRMAARCLLIAIALFMIAHAGLGALL